MYKEKRFGTILLLQAVLLLILLGAAALNAAGETSYYLPAVMGSSPYHFDDCAELTGNNATIGVPGDVTINGELKLGKGDEIAIFNESGSLCAGMKVWDGHNIAITAWGDDPLSDEIDGLLEGEAMRYRIWDRSDKQEREAAAATYKMGDGLYKTNGIYIVESLTIE